MKGTILGLAKAGNMIKVKIKNSATGKINENLAYMNLKDQLIALKGQETDLQVKKQDNGSYVVSGIGPYENKGYGGKKGGYNKSYGGGNSKPYDNVGQQVGNCITNAIVILGPGKTIADYEKVAIELVAMGNRIRAVAEKSTEKKSSDGFDDFESELETDVSISNDVSLDDDISF